MIAKKKLFDAYDSWEQLTQAEGSAIQSGDWSRVAECQQAKQGLQKKIIHLTESAQAECIETGLDSKNFERDLRPIINNLISMESHNSELLAIRRQAADVEKLDLDQASQNLRRVQKSYSPPASPVWNSYS
jgi:hypothetical protein